MFDLESSVQSWKQSLASREGMQPERVEELEDHLRASIEHLSSTPAVKGALTPEEIFDVAKRRMGGSQALADEFERLAPGDAVRRRWIWMLAGYVGFHFAFQVILTATVPIAVFARQLDPVLGSILFAVGVLGGVALVVALVRSAFVRRAADRATNAVLGKLGPVVGVVCLGLVALLASALITPLQAIVTARYAPVGGNWSTEPATLQIQVAIEQGARIVAFAVPFVILAILVVRRRSQERDTVSN